MREVIVPKHIRPSGILKYIVEIVQENIKDSIKNNGTTPDQIVLDELHQWQPDFGRSGCVPYENWRELPTRGKYVYFVTNGDQVCYVGRTKGLNSRFACHSKQIFFRMLKAPFVWWIELKRIKQSSRWWKLLSYACWSQN